MGEDIIKLSDYNDIVANFEKVSSMLNKQPSKKHIKQNAMADNTQYIPISIIEKTLDESFAGLWSTRNCKIYQMLNSVVCELELEVVMNGVKITRIGVGAVPIQLKKGEVEIAPHTINIMGLQKNVPAAKSFALSNAAQSLGEIFGRNLNRKETDIEYIYGTEQTEKYEPLAEECIELLKSSKIAAKETIYKSIRNASYEKLIEIKS